MWLGGGGGLVSQSCPALATPWTAADQAPLCPWDSLGKNTGVGCLLQRTFLPQRFSSRLLRLLCWRVGSISSSNYSSLEYRNTVDFDVYGLPW